MRLPCRTPPPPPPSPPPPPPPQNLPGEYVSHCPHSPGPHIHSLTSPSCTTALSCALPRQTARPVQGMRIVTPSESRQRRADSCLERTSSLLACSAHGWRPPGPTPHTGPNVRLSGTQSGPCGAAAHPVSNACACSDRSWSASTSSLPPSPQSDTVGPAPRNQYFNINLHGNMNPHALRCANFVACTASC